MRNFNRTALLLSVSLFGLYGTAQALPTTMPLGYCDGETKPIENLSSAKAGVWSSGAIYIIAKTKRAQF
jgi:hypothetical protein